MATVIDSWRRGGLSFRLLTQTSRICSPMPTVTINAPSGAVILGGGASVDWDSSPCSPPCPPGNMLTAMYPNNIGTTWTVASKEHIQANNARITAYCIIAQMLTGAPIPPANYTIVAAMSGPPASIPTAQANLPVGFTIVGGGARVNPNAANNMLFESYPKVGLKSWVGSATDHLVPSQATITVWAIGLKDTFLSANGLVITSTNSPSPSANQPKKTYVIPNFYLTGVGAKVNLVGPGNLLIASFPEDRQIAVAEGKDHLVSNATTVTAYAVGFT